MAKEEKVENEGNFNDKTSSDDKNVSSQSTKIDELLISLGVWGRFQVLQFVILKVLSFPAGAQLFTIWFIGYQPPLRCALSESNMTANSTYSDNGHGFYTTCKQLLDNRNGTDCLHGYEYRKVESASTTVTDWDTVCGRSYQAQLAQTVLIAGQAVGATLCTALADRFGRRPVCILAQVGMIVSSVALTLSPNVIVYLFLRFVIGLVQQGHVTMMTVMPLEILPTNHRAAVHLFGGLFWNGFMAIFVGMGYAFRDTDWRYLQHTLTGVSVVILIINLFVVEESIRWLFANQKNEEALALISKACRMNQANKADVMEKAHACIEKSKDKEIAVDFEEVPLADVKITHLSWQNRSKYSFVDVWRNPRLRVTSVVMFFGWIVTAFTSFGLTLTTHRLAGDRFLNYFLLIVSSLPATVISYITMTRLGRRFTVILFSSVTGVLMIITVLLHTFIGDSASTAITVLTITSTNTMNSVFGSLFQYTPELFPTNLRSIGVGIASTASRIGGMVGPFSNMLIEYFPWAPGTLYGCLSIIVSFLYTLLPETLDKELPQTIDEINKWKKGKRKTKGLQLEEMSSFVEEPSKLRT